MGDIYDIFTKKKVDKPRATPYHKRYMQCLKEIADNGKCECQICLDKKDISKKLFNIVYYLCKDYKEKTGNSLYVADALEMVLTVAIKLKNSAKI